MSPTGREVPGVFPRVRARRDAAGAWLLRSCAAVGVGVAALTCAFVAVGAVPALGTIGTGRLLTDDGWSPRSGMYDLTPMLAGSAAAALGSALLTIPLGVGVAVFGRFYAPRPVAAALDAGVSLLAGVPSVVYGLWGLTVLVPLLAAWSPLGQGQSLLAGVLVLTAMTLPVVTLASSAALAAVPAEQLAAASAMGLRRSTTVAWIALPAAAGGILAGATLQVARAVGETMAVLMVCGNIVRVPGSVWEPIRTLTANIALEMGYADDLHRSALFAGGLFLLLAVGGLLLLEQALRGGLARWRRRGAGAAPPEAPPPEAAAPGPAPPEPDPPPVTLGLPVLNAGVDLPPPGLPAADWLGDGLLRRPRRLRPGSLLVGGFAGGSALLVAGFCVLLLADLARRGLPHLSWSFFTEAPADAGRAGGIAPVLVSTAVIVAVALLAAVPLSLGFAGALTELTRPGGWVGRSLRRALDVLAATPSIVFGLFGDALFNRVLGWGPSLLAGGLTLACMMLPVTTRLFESGLSGLPPELRRSAEALGLRRTTTFVRVLVPAAAPALAAGVTLGLGRALAETAALLFTAGYATRAPGSVLDPGRALSVHVFELAMNVTGGEPHAYASAAVLVGAIVGLNGLTLLATRGLFRGRGR